MKTKQDLITTLTNMIRKTKTNILKHTSLDKANNCKKSITQNNKGDNS